MTTRWLLSNVFLFISQKKRTRIKICTCTHEQRGSSNLLIPVLKSKTRGSAMCMLHRPPVPPTSVLLFSAALNLQSITRWRQIFYFYSATWNNWNCNLDRIYAASEPWYHIFKEDWCCCCLEVTAEGNYGSMIRSPQCLTLCRIIHTQGSGQRVQRVETSMTWMTEKSPQTF